MPDTILSSANEEVVIGCDHPFVVIGERINPTGRTQLTSEMESGNFDRVELDALAQIAAGAKVLDVNTGVPMADEPALMAKVVELVQSMTSVPISIDSSMPDALEAGLAAYQGKALVNSVTGEDERLDTVLPIVAKHGAAVVAICHDDSGISNDPDKRIEAAKKIIERAADYGIPVVDVVLDPVVMPIGAAGESGRAVFEVIRRAHQELRVNTVCGASNVSFGLPDRRQLNAVFLSMMVGYGLTAAIVNPLHDEVMAAISGAEVLTGQDRMCKRWIKRSRTRQEPLLDQVSSV
ncbi:MAG: dihydropteroate synthase [Arenicellales bacterium]|jgi:5-methyltetrahydrofolate--homocysteine methyltransferase|nr:dihydropteroate synthase [Arenicellales bacterium]